MVVKLTRLTHNIPIQLQLVAAVPFSVLAPSGQSGNTLVYPKNSSSHSQLYLGKYGNLKVYIYIWKTYGPTWPRVSSRWNRTIQAELQIFVMLSLQESWIRNEFYLQVERYPHRKSANCARRQNQGTQFFFESRQMDDGFHNSIIIQSFQAYRSRLFTRYTMTKRRDSYSWFSRTPTETGHIGM
jgi:hypothetical protein